MDRIIVKQGEYDKGDAAFPLIRDAALSLGGSSMFQLAGDAELQLTGSLAGGLDVKRSPEGKPYLIMPDGNAAAAGISVTHSGDIWMCLISERGQCGIDFQYAGKEHQEKIAGRFFTEGENGYIRSGGSFLDVWCRREALGKYTGKGFFGDYPDTCPGGVLAESVCVRGAVLWFHEITVAVLEAVNVRPCGDFRAVAVSEDPGEPVVMPAETVQPGKPGRL